MKRILYLPAALLAYWAIAQNAPQPLSAMFPAGALLYLESKDFHALMADWDSSAEKSTWLQSANHEAFSRSRLFLKLGQAQKEFATAAGVPPDYAMLGAVAGGNSALAMYQIGDLQFLYATHLASARALDTALWKARGSYQTRRAGGVDYFLKEDTASHRVAAFAYAGDVLLLATKEELIAGALELIARQSRPTVASEQWFQDTTAAAGTPGELRLIYNLDRLETAPHFRSYWVQRNISALKEFSAGIADLDRARGESQERRVLLRTNPSTPVTDEAPAAQLIALVPDDAGVYRATLHPGADVSRAIERRFFSTSAASPESRIAPEVSISAERGSEQDLETRIDTAPLDHESSSFTLTGQPEAMLELSRSIVDADQVFIGTRAAIVLLGDGLTIDPGEMPLVVVHRGRLLIVADSQELADAIVRKIGTPAAAGAVYAASWRHARELPSFERMTRLIDFPQIPPSGDEREPMFFSENLASLGRVFRRVQSEEIVVHDAGSMLREMVVYRIAP